MVCFRHRKYLAERTTVTVRGGKGELMVLLLDLEGMLVAQFLGGPVAEIRRCGFDNYCDHVFSWQFVAEKMLRLKFNVLPDSSLTNFIGLPKSIEN